MNRPFSARQRAEQFDSLVEGGRRDDVDRATSDLLEVVGALRSAPEAHPRPEFVADLRERLMVAAATEWEPATAARKRTTQDDTARLTIKPRHSRRERRIGILVGAAAIIGATTSMAVASQSAIPGDTLYPVKRAIESTQTGFSVGDDSKGQKMLGNASSRLDEVDKLTTESKPDPDLVISTLDTFSDQATEAGDLLMADYEQTGHAGSIEALHTFATQSIDSLTALETAVPDSAHDALLNAAHAVIAIDAAAENVCPDCGDTITDVPGQLLAGDAATLHDVAAGLANAGLPGTDPSADPSASGRPQQGGGKGGGHAPSGLTPPETPIDLPSTQPSDSGDPGDSGDSGADDPSHPVSSGAPETGDHHTGDGNGTDPGDGSGSGGGGKTDQTDQPPPLIDLTPVTDTVGQVLTGVVGGLSGVLGGLTGGLLGGGSTATPSP